MRKPAAVDTFEPFVEYVAARLAEDPHLWARTLCDELEALGYPLSYSTLTRQIRSRNLRPAPLRELRWAWPGPFAAQ